MKIRTDFVTNSSSSSFITVIVSSDKERYEQNFYNFDIADLLRGDDQNDRLSDMLQAESTEDLFGSIFKDYKNGCINGSFARPYGLDDDDDDEYYDCHKGYDRLHTDCYDCNRYKNHSIPCKFSQKRIPLDEILSKDIGDLVSVEIDNVWWSDEVRVERVEYYDLKQKAIKTFDFKK